MTTFKEIEELFDTLWPINRSLTGNGVRKTLKIISDIIDLDIIEVSSGEKIYDWTIPKEWNVKDAYIVTPSGKKIANFKKNNLHLLGYSHYVNKEMYLKELLNYLYTLPDQPNAIPYLTSYYKRRWGFCLTHNELKKLKKGKYRVFIDAEHSKGSLTLADKVIKGKSSKEVFFSTYICHPSMANNELSGPIIMTYLCRELLKKKNLNYTYRFAFVPETIGALAYLKNKGEHLKNNTLAGFVVTCVGDSGPFTYKKTKEEDTYTNKVVIHLLDHYCQGNYKVRNFVPFGSDERQYSSPGFNLPVGSLMRTMYGEYEQYHTSLDNKSFISFDSMHETINIFLKLVYIFEINDYYINQNPYGEPQLGKRGLYPTIGSKNAKDSNLSNILYLLNYSDGKHDLIDIANIIGCSVFELIPSLKSLISSGLIKRPNIN